MSKKEPKITPRSQLYDRLNVSVSGLNWFISGLIVALLAVLILALMTR